MMTEQCVEFVGYKVSSDAEYGCRSSQKRSEKMKHSQVTLAVFVAALAWMGSLGHAKAYDVSLDGAGNCFTVGMAAWEA